MTYAIQGRENLLKLARPEGFEPPTRGVESLLAILGHKRARGDFPGRNKHLRRQLQR